MKCGSNFPEPFRNIRFAECDILTIFASAIPVLNFHCFWRSLLPVFGVRVR